MNGDSISASDLPSIQALYDCSRFLDAYEKTQGYWNPSTDLSRLSTEQLILGGRLAIRLGGRAATPMAFLMLPTNANLTIQECGTSLIA
jgi:hypothetical protein